MGDSFGALVGASLIGIVAALLFSIAIFALMCWLLYAIIWRAVRRGLREYNGEMRRFSTSEFLGWERQR